MCNRLALSLLSIVSVAATAQISNQAGYPPRPSPKPYTMTQVRTTTQTYGDGLTRTTTQKTTTARDSNGRTLNETELSNPAPAIYDRDGRRSFQTGSGSPTRMVNVNDPVTQTNWSWMVGDTQLHEARINSYASYNSRAQSRMSNASRPPASGNLPVIEVHTETLGTRAIQGVIAIGTRTTAKYPAGYDGWNREFTSTQEAWHALDNGYLVESTNDDPRNGKTVVTLVSFTDGEPDPALFKPPADYKILTQVTTEAPADKP